MLRRGADRAPTLRAIAVRGSHDPGSAGVSPALTDAQAWHSRGYLPHVDRPGLAQMITFRLADSLPSNIVESIAAGSTAGQQARTRLERLLDDGFGAGSLRDARLAEAAEGAPALFDGERHHLFAWCVMPNHVHVMIETRSGHPLAGVVHSWKSYTAKLANKLSGRSGAFWQPEYYDRVIRDERHLAAAISYIEGNPVKAGLAGRPEDWPFSSARVAGPTADAGETPALPWVDLLSPLRESGAAAERLSLPGSCRQTAEEFAENQR